MQNFSAGSIRGARAWQYFTGSNRHSVAVIDGGLNYLHPDLAENAWRNPGEIPHNGIDDDRNGFIDDIHGADVTTGSGDPLSSDDHGSHVAGVIGARGNNEIGIAGVNWNASIIGVKASGSDGYFTTKTLVKAIDYVVDLKTRRGIPIVAVNASLGGYNSSTLELDAMRRLREAGILLVAAAGNESVNIDRNPIYPANYHLDNIISVVASDRQGARAGFSNYGFIEADIAAPGIDILSTISGDSYALMDGTSMAAPFVTGAISLLASSAPHLSWKELRQHIFDTGRPLAELERFTSTGRLLDLERLMANSAGVTTLSEGAPSNPLQREEAFRLSLTSSKGRITKALPLGRKFLIKAVRENVAVAPTRGVATSTTYVELSINRSPCRRPVKVYGISDPSYTLIAEAPSSPLIQELRITLLNGEGVAVSKRKLSLVGAKAGMQKTSKRTLEQVCARVIASLEFVQ
jgi:hypothetical protein